MSSVAPSPYASPPAGGPGPAGAGSVPGASADPYAAPQQRGNHPPRQPVPPRRGPAPNPSAPVPQPSSSNPATPSGNPADLIVTGEAVALELRPAGLMSRIGSGVVDLAVYGIIGVAIILLCLRFIVNDSQAGVLIVSTMAVMMVIVPTAVETITRGLSAGKVAMGLRVVRDDGGPVRFRQAFVRALTAVGEIWFCLGSIAVLTAIFNNRSKRLGDFLAGTYAVRERGTELAVAPLLMPPDLGAWAERADIRRLPDNLALHARVFLSRTGTLAPYTRLQLGRALAAAIEPYVSPPPPWGTNPERFVAAVLVERRDREYAAGLEGQARRLDESEHIRRLPYGVTDYA
ncbi:RDD family protein [Occultella gossypii]|nr:RDD family protein [Occultella gossypii]